MKTKRLRSMKKMGLRSTEERNLLKVIRYTCSKKRWNLSTLMKRSLKMNKEIMKMQKKVLKMKKKVILTRKNTKEKIFKATWMRKVKNNCKILNVMLLLLSNNRTKSLSMLVSFLFKFSRLSVS